MKLTWGTFALEDRRAIYDYLDERDPAAAVATDKHIVNAVQRLRDYPNSGRPGRVDATRELVVIGTPYIVAYRVFDDRVKLLAVYHGAREWPSTFSDD